MNLPALKAARREAVAELDRAMNLIDAHQRYADSVANKIARIDECIDKTTAAGLVAEVRPLRLEIEG